MATPSLIFFMKPQAYTEFQPLKEILVGTCYDMSYLEGLDIPFTKKTKNLMQHLLDETEEDYESLINILKTLGVKVYRPSKETYKNKEIWKKGLSGAYLMNPRDDQIVLHNKVVWGNVGSIQEKGFADAIEDYSKYFLRDPKFTNLIGASIVRLGEDIIVDSGDFGNTHQHVKRLREYFEPLGYNIIYTKTHDFKFKQRINHSDGVFAILKPGLILHAAEDSHYSENLFKGWDMIKVDIDNHSYDALDFKEFLKEKNAYQHEISYAFEDDKYNDEKWFGFLNTWFESVLGYSKETYFDVNCLVVDEENVIFSNYNKDLFKQLEKFKINPIVSPFRHRLFWDGGIHCMTLDLKRDGSREKYL